VNAPVSPYDAKPWLALYDEGLPAELELEHPNALAMFRASAQRAGERPAVHYFGATLTFADLDRLSDGLAAGLLARGVARGDRVAVYLQNVPQFALATLATWKAGAIAVSVNPMYKQRELRELLEDSGAVALVTLESLWRAAAREVVPATAVHTVITTSELDFARELHAAPLAGSARDRDPEVDDLLELAGAHAGERPEPPDLGPDDVAFLTYTSGTTGPPKGAMNTHRNVVYNAQAYRDWVHLTGDDVVLGVAPLFHITGLIAHLAVALLVPMPLVLGFRFDPAATLELIERHRTSFTIGSITVFIALMNAPGAAERDLSSLTKVYSGGAPIAPPTVEAFERQFGAYIHNVYGLTETTSPALGVPFSRRAPVDPSSGALSVGVPTFGTTVRVLDDDGAELPVGEIGELVTSGPQVVPGYWNKPEETEHALPGGALHTGDVGFMDPDGWFYLVDRKKDQINAAGYKVWPREVEDVLYGHPAVREAAVVGVPDAYRGESVKAFVSLKAGAAAQEDELIAFCRERMAAYKYPRAVEVVDELPKTVTGKLLRRELRAREAATREAG
jgi:long-chain acyl-CoA synthetase